MARRPPKRKLLVEGETEKRVNPYLVEANGITWEEDDRPVVYIQPYDGIENLLTPGVIDAELKASRLEALELLVDANGSAPRQWQRIRNRYREIFSQPLPDDIPDSGLTHIPDEGARFGLWIMPNNRYAGMLEDHLIEMIPPSSGSLFALAQRCVENAKRSGAPFRDAHRAKAEIHTWLAWQDEPGRQLHEAVLHQILEPRSASSQPFIDWFRRLFEL